MNAEVHKLDEFCPIAKTDLLKVNDIVGYFYTFVLVSAVGYLTSIVQKFTVVRLNDNAEIKVQELIIEISISVVSILFVILKTSDTSNSLITDYC